VKLSFFVHDIVVTQERLVAPDNEDYFWRTGKLCDYSSY